jgi:uncharacterized protein (DUF1778 family)
MPARREANLRSKTLRIRVTRDEAELLETAAGVAGSASVSAFIRETLVGHAKAASRRRPGRSGG